MPSTRPSHLRGRGPAGETHPVLRGTQMRHYPLPLGTAGPHSCAASRGVSAAGDLSPGPDGAPGGTPENRRYRRRSPHRPAQTAYAPAGRRLFAPAAPALPLPPSQGRFGHVRPCP